MSQIVSLIGKNSYSGFINWASKEDQHINAVHIARFNHPDHGKCEAYAKMFPYENGTNRGLINEITGYLFAHAIGIPQPEIAFVAEIPTWKLTNKPKWLNGIDYYPAFCTKRMDARAAAFRLPDAQIPSLIASVDRWKHITPTVCMDESVSNTDRHLNNLLKTGKDQYAIIDTDRIASTIAHPHWTTQSLDHAALYENKLSRIIWNHRPKDKNVSLMLSHSPAISSAFSQIKDEINYWTTKLLDKEEKAAFTQFLAARSNQLDQLLRQRYNRLL